MNWADLQPPSIDPMWSTLGPQGPPGRDGKAGRDGQDGSDGDDGTDGLGLTLRGNWNRVAHYKPGDVVTHAFESYVARSANVGRRPARGSRVWQLLAARGAKGRDGANDVIMARGPRGFPGEDGKTVVVGGGGGPSLEIEFGVPIPIGEAIYIAANGMAYPAHANSQTASGVVGFAVGDGLYITEGQVELSGLLAGHEYYLSADDPGGITNTPPDLPGQWVVPVGRALNATTLDIELGPGVLLSGNTTIPGRTISATFDSATDEGMVVYVSGSGTVGLAQANAAGTTCAIGLANEDVASGSIGEYLTEGQVTRTDWTGITGTETLTPGAKYCLSPSQPGRMTTVPPTGAGEYVAVLGTALTESTFDIEIQPPILLVGDSGPPPLDQNAGGGGSDSSGSVAAATFDSFTRQGRAVYISGNGSVGLALASAEATTGAIGLAIDTYSAGESGEYITGGQLQLPDWGFITGTGPLTPGADYFLSKDTPGQLTTVPPTDAGEYVVFIGRAISEDTLDLEVERPILLSGNTNASALVTITATGSEVALPNGAVVDSAFLNGLLLREDDFSISSGTLTVDCATADDFVVVKYLGT